MLTTQKIKPQQFLDWLVNRLKFKHKEDEIVLTQIQNLLDNYIIFPKKISIDWIDQICKKHYPDFDLDKVTEMNIGYTDDQRMQIRNLVIDIIKDTSSYDL